MSRLVPFMGRNRARVACVALALWCVVGCGPGSSRDPGDATRVATSEAPRGPRGGRLFAGDGFQLELIIAEDGIPPEFRAFLSDDRGRPLSPSGARLVVTLERFGGRRDTLPFQAETEFLRSLKSVHEPHSFLARLRLDRDGRTQEWTYEQREGRVELPPEAVARGDIGLGQAGPRPIEVRVEAPGEVHLNAERVVQVRPRYPGVLQRLAVHLGDAVRSGDLLAVVHSNESLTEYEIHAPMPGTVIARDVAVGQSVDHEHALYTLADLSTVWVDFALYPRFAGQIRRGQAARVRAGTEDGGLVRGTVSYVGPLLEQDTRVSYGRIVLANPDGRWAPGLYVTVAVTVDRVHAPVAVPEAAIVRTARGPAVFRAAGTTFELQPVTPGRSDGEWTEIVDGLEPGARIVTRNAFLLKAELGKTEATHDH